MSLPTPDEVFAFMDRMVEAGLIRRFARDQENLVADWTPEGAQFARTFNDLAKDANGNADLRNVFLVMVVLQAHGPKEGGNVPNGRL